MQKLLFILLLIFPFFSGNLSAKEGDFIDFVFNTNSADKLKEYLEKHNPDLSQTNKKYCKYAPNEKVYIYVEESNSSRPSIRGNCKKVGHSALDVALFRRKSDFGKKESCSMAVMLMKAGAPSVAIKGNAEDDEMISMAFTLCLADTEMINKDKRMLSNVKYMITLDRRLMGTPLNGYVAFHHAVMSGNFEIVKTIFSQAVKYPSLYTGKSITSFDNPDGYGTNSLQLALRYNKRKVACFLRKAGGAKAAWPEDWPDPAPFEEKDSKRNSNRASKKKGSGAHIEWSFTIVTKEEVEREKARERERMKIYQKCLQGEAIK